MGILFLPPSVLQQVMLPLLLFEEVGAMASISKDVYGGLRRIRAADSLSVRCTRSCGREPCSGMIARYKSTCAKAAGHLGLCLCEACFGDLGIQLRPGDQGVWCHYCDTLIRGVIFYDQEGNALHFGCFQFGAPPPNGVIARRFR